MGDDDWTVNGDIIDPTGPTGPANPAGGPQGAMPIPTLGEWSLVLLGLLAAAMGAAGVRRRR